VIARPERRSRTGTDRRIWTSSSVALDDGVAANIEDPAEPCRAEMDVDLIGPDLDAADHGGKKGTLACCRQLGPALADLHGSRDQAALR
jgi:hypothetical protein